MIVPGSPHEGLNHPFSWHARVRNKNSGKERDYWMNGSEASREDVAQHIAVHFPNVEVLTIDRCTRQPDKMLQPVPPEDFQFGVLHEADVAPDPSLSRPQAIRAAPIISLPPIRPIASLSSIRPLTRSK